MSREALRDAVEAAVTAVGFYSEDPNEQAFALAVALVNRSGDALPTETLDAAGLRLRVSKALLTLLHTVPEYMQAEVLLDVSATLAAAARARSGVSQPGGSPS